jgi:hypothetical protein
MIITKIDYQAAFEDNDRLKAEKTSTPSSCSLMGSYGIQKDRDSASTPTSQETSQHASLLTRPPVIPAININTALLSIIKWPRLS